MKLNAKMPNNANKRGRKKRAGYWRRSLGGYEKPMEMIRVNSSAISAVGYDSQTKRMKIRFSQGRTYDFCRVPEHVFEGLLRAGSKGTYYNDHIKDRYQCY